MLLRLYRLRKKIYNKRIRSKLTILTCPNCMNTYDILLEEKNYTMCPYCDYEYNPKDSR